MAEWLFAPYKADTCLNSGTQRLDGMDQNCRVRSLATGRGCCSRLDYWQCRTRHSWSHLLSNLAVKLTPEVHTRVPDWKLRSPLINYSFPSHLATEAERVGSSGHFSGQMWSSLPILPAWISWRRTVRVRLSSLAGLFRLFDDRPLLLRLCLEVLPATFSAERYDGIHLNQCLPAAKTTVSFVFLSGALPQPMSVT